MYFYNFEDYNALFDLIDYTRVRAGLYFKLLRHYNITTIEELYLVCKNRYPKKEKIITSNIDSHIARALDLLLFPKKEMILPVARFYGKRLKEFLGGRKVSFSGALLRGEPTLNVIELVVEVESQEEIKKKLKEFYLFGEFIKIDKGIIIFRSKRGHIYKLYIAEPSNYGNTLFYFSFPESVIKYIKDIFPDYNISSDKIIYNNNVYKFSTEERLFKFLGIQFIPYELRWDKDAIGKAIKKELPELVEASMVIGDFHIHTMFSDGEGYVEDIVNVARELNYEYVAITEHSISQKSGNGISVSDWKLERDLITKIDSNLSPFKIFSGLEVDILGDGGLDFPYHILKQMDIVILALHHPEIGTLDPNEKIAYGMRSGIGSILAHPKDRYWGKEPRFALDIEYLFENATKYGVALEISSIPDRIGFTAEEIKKGKQKGVKFAINSDAHAPGYLKNIDIGIIRARRGWLTKDDIINTYNYERLKELKIIKKG